MKAVEKDANGPFKVESYPSQTLSQADEIYDAVINSIADIGITAQDYINGCFPLSQIVELPGVLQTLYDDGQIAGEHDDTHVLFMFTRARVYPHARDGRADTFGSRRPAYASPHVRGGQHSQEYGR